MSAQRREPLRGLPRNTLLLQGSRIPPVGTELSFQTTKCVHLPLPRLLPNPASSSETAGALLTLQTFKFRMVLLWLCKSLGGDTVSAPEITLALRTSSLFQGSQVKPKGQTCFEVFGSFNQKLWVLVLSAPRAFVNPLFWVQHTLKQKSVDVSQSLWQLPSHFQAGLWRGGVIRRLRGMPGLTVYIVWGKGTPTPSSSGPGASLGLLWSVPLGGESPDQSPGGWFFCLIKFSFHLFSGNHGQFCSFPNLTILCVVFIVRLCNHVQQSTALYLKILQPRTISYRNPHFWLLAKMEA